MPSDGDVKEKRNAYLNREAYSLRGRIIIITGASAGVGKEAARDLALRGATIVMGNRNLEKSYRVIQALREEEGREMLPDDRFVVKRLDLSDLDSVREFAEEVKKDYPVIDVLINNAGKMAGKRMVTKDGYESQFQINHLGHFLLTFLLIENILESENKPRIINVSSKAHKHASDNFINDLQSEKRYGWKGIVTYSNTKLMNIWFTKVMARKYEGRITTYAVHPGCVKTDLKQNSLTCKLIYCGTWCCSKSVRKGAYTTIYCTVSAKAGQQTGLYYSGSKVTKPMFMAEDEELAQRLWIESCRMLNINWDLTNLKENFIRNSENSSKKYVSTANDSKQEQSYD